jgi:hypothetical protein
MHEFYGLSVNHASWLCLYLYSTVCCDVRASQNVLTSILSNLKHLKFLLAVAHLGRRFLFRLGRSWYLAIYVFIPLGPSILCQTLLYTLNSKQQLNSAVVREFVVFILKIHSNKFLSRLVKFCVVINELI